MQKRNKRLILILSLNLTTFFISHAQLNGFIKSGLNVGTINQEWWTYQDSIRYGKALIRPIFGIGAQYTFSSSWFIRQELMFQIKGQGTVRPDVRTFFRTKNPDILRFISFPFSIHRKIVPNVYFGAGFQPSLYLSGSDNYYAKEIWHGWIYSGNVSIQYILKESFELGFEYDHDFTLYYCPACEIRFFTYRMYGIYHFPSK